ncbi:MAG: ATP-binding cassette domain-containing protein [Bacteroidaceae bacterium]|nr:ATP-binding cassette domain-containing protein [Bacteroidales bacterium]MBQ8257444.1 ATP-binding cassette domain-containing protein [Bacteroidaceae bacterium]
MIEVKDIHKKFGSQTVLDNINAIFDNGKANLIIGQSGAGKTVLLKCIVGLLEPEEGKVLYDGRNILSFNKREKQMLRREMGMLFQNAALFDSMSVLENVMFPLDMFSDKTYNERLKRARFCLERVNLLDAQDKSPEELSGGMQKRAAIARAIALEPRYLFCDEPNSGLDPKTSLIIDELIHGITTEYDITTIVNTHDMNSVMNIGDHIIFLADGKISWEGNKDHILNTDNKRLNEFLFSSEILRRVAGDKQ